MLKQKNSKLRLKITNVVSNKLNHLDNLKYISSCVINSKLLLNKLIKINLS